jgi:hypothetical protein
MTIKLALGLVDEMVAFLTEELPDILIAEEVLWDDDVELPPPTEYVKRHPSSLQRINNPPYMHIMVDRTEIFDWHTDSVLANHMLMMWLVAVNADPELLQVQIYRYGNALWKALVAAHSDAGVTYELATPEGARMPIMDYRFSIADNTMAMGNVQLTTWYAKHES